jgi:transposase
VDTPAHPQNTRKRRDVPAEPPCLTLTDAEWATIEPILPDKRKTEKGRQRISAMIGVLRAKCGWRVLDPWTTYYNQYRAWRDTDWWNRMMSALEQAGSEPIIDRSNKAAANSTLHDKVTLLNAKSDIEAAFDDASNAASGFLTALSQTDDALYRALQKIYEFVKAGEGRPEEFEIFKQAKGIKRPHNAKSRFQHYAKYFIKANTDRKDIVGRASKYGAALDEAWEQDVDSERLSGWIKDRGIENICKERRRRNALRKAKEEEATAEVVCETADPISVRGLPVLPSGKPLSDITSRRVLKLNREAEQCDDPEEREYFQAQLDKLASVVGLGSDALVKLAQEREIITQSLVEWGDDEQGREIGRLRVILHRHGISWLN